jgi:hypothetical protein
MNKITIARQHQGLYVEVVAVLATTSALECARVRLSPSLLPPEVMEGTMCEPEAAEKAVASGCSKLLVMLILLIEFLRQGLHVRGK